MVTQIPKPLEQAYGRTAVLIPAYNAEATVGRVVEQVRRISPDLTVLVVDDGSTDATGPTARSAGATVLRHERNLGKGTALRTGFDDVVRRDLDAVITLDADGQHSPEEIPSLLGCWINTQADIVIGARRRVPGTMPWIRIFTNTVSTWLVSLSAGQMIPDSQSGYRLLSTEVIREVKTRSSGYGAESELLIKGVSRGFRIAATPISTIYENEKSYIHPVKQPLLFLGLILRSFFWRFERIGKEERR
jgi:glycosyltransferase involved in cell wall biosynthesis